MDKCKCGYDQNLIAACFIVGFVFAIGASAITLYLLNLN